MSGNYIEIMVYQQTYQEAYDAVLKFTSKVNDELKQKISNLLDEVEKTRCANIEDLSVIKQLTAILKDTATFLTNPDENHRSLFEKKINEKHLLSTIPYYLLSGLVAALTALVAAATVVSLTAGAPVVMAVASFALVTFSGSWFSNSAFQEAKQRSELNQALNDMTTPSSTLNC